MSQNLLPITTAKRDWPLRESLKHAKSISNSIRNSHEHTWPISHESKKGWFEFYVSSFYHCLSFLNLNNHVSLYRASYHLNNSKRLNALKFQLNFKISFDDLILISIVPSNRPVFDFQILTSARHASDWNSCFKLPKDCTMLISENEFNWSLQGIKLKFLEWKTICNPPTRTNKSPLWVYGGVKGEGHL